MLDTQTQQTILSLTKSFWAQEITTPEFAVIASGKEIGHRIADLVDERTTNLLANHLQTRQQRKNDGSTMPRSMGDIWVLSNGMYNPVNIKSGEMGKQGQPNMVSLKKLLRALLLRQIDAYYLLLVKMKLGVAPEAYIYLVDILEHLDVTTFDSGPGQIMLKERLFYQRMDDNAAPQVLTADEKIARLFEMLEDADRRLQENRQRVQQTIQEMRTLYQSTVGQSIDQSGLKLQ